MEELKAIPEELLHFVPWKGSSHPLWLGTSLSLRRNILPYIFPAKMKTKEAENLRGVIKEVLSVHPALQNSSYFPLEMLKPLEKQILFETFPGMITRDALHSGQAIIMDKSCHRLLSINLQDHLYIRVNDFDGEWEKSFNDLMVLEETLASSLSFAFLEKFGYLTAAPTHAGTGFEALFFLHLPLLLRHYPEKLSDQEIPDSIEIVSLQGDREDFLGDVVILKNACSLGINEAMTLKTLFSTAIKLITAEEQLRKAQQPNIPAEIKDMISRAMGLLAHSYQLKTTETINALSLLKLGLDLGFITGITHQKLNELFFLSQRAHLSAEKHLDVADETTIISERASWLHEELKNVQHTP